MSPDGNTRWDNPEMHTKLVLAIVEACLKDGKLVRTQAKAASRVMEAKGFNVTGEAIRVNVKTNIKVKVLVQYQRGFVSKANRGGQWLSGR
ncbi:hypothetical protein AB5N19_13257 [Seiridium cardinale]